MTSQNVALRDINIALLDIILFIVTEMFYLWKNELFDFQQA